MTSRDRVLDSLLRRGGGRLLSPSEPEVEWFAREAVLTDTERVVSLAVRPFDHSEKSKVASRFTREFKTRKGKMSLRPIQAVALKEIRETKGLLAPIGVGHGKTLIALLAGTAIRAKLTIVLVPASTLQQFESVASEMREHWRIPDNLRVYSYSALSQAKNSDLLARLVSRYTGEEVLLVADEAHRLKRLESARTKRLIRFFQAYPWVRFAALSGTFTSRSIHEFSHLSEIALRENSPLPYDRTHLRNWSATIDSPVHRAVATPEEWEAVRPLWEWQEKQLGWEYSEGEKRLLTENMRVAFIRDAFRRRLWATPGVVATDSSAVNCSLNIFLLHEPSLPSDVAELEEECIDRGETPDGEILEDPIAVWRFRRQLTQGFYYVWDWPNGEEDTEWLLARRDWQRRVRSELVYSSREGYDSPLLVFNEISRQVDSGARQAIHRSFSAWVEQKHKPPPPTRPVWISRYLVNWAVEQLSCEPTIVWYESAAMGEALREHGVEVFGAGDNPPQDKAFPCALSVAAHGEGKNLQAWSRQIVLTPSSSGAVWEQLVGRTHRIGQMADEVEVHVVCQSPVLRDAWSRAMSTASYIEASTGNRQKLLYATVCGGPNE